MFLVLSNGCLCPIHWNLVLSRCSWSSTNRWCSNYIWVINKFISYYGATYIWGLTVSTRIIQGCCTETGAIQGCEAMYIKAEMSRSEVLLKKIHHYLTHWGRDKMDANSQTTSSSAFSWMEMFEFRLKFHWSLVPRVQLTIFQHWFR